MDSSNKPSRTSWVFRRLRSPVFTTDERSRRTTWCKPFIVSFRKSTRTGCFLKKERCAYRPLSFPSHQWKTALFKMSFLLMQLLPPLFLRAEERYRCFSQTKRCKPLRHLSLFKHKRCDLLPCIALPTDPLRVRRRRFTIITRMFLTNSLVELKRFVFFMMMGRLKSLPLRVSDYSHKASAYLCGGEYET